MRARWGEREEDLTPQIDGSKTEFTTSTPFRRGTARLYVNGLDQGLSGVCFVEVDETTVRFDEFVLRSPDTLEVRYIPV